MQSQDPQPIQNEAIDKYLQDMGRQMSEEQKNKCHIFNSSFYVHLLACDIEAYINTPGIQKEKFNMLNNHLKNINIIDKEFIFVPWNDSGSWLLIGVCFLEELVQKDTVLLLYCDSRKCSENTSYDQISVKIGEFLHYVYWKKSGQYYKFSKIKIKRFKNVPCHENVEDSALYMLQFIENILESIDEDSNKCPGKPKWFSYEDIAEKRSKIQKLTVSKIADENDEQANLSTTWCKYCNSRNINNSGECLTCNRKLPNREKQTFKRIGTPFIETRHGDSKKKIPIHKIDTSDESPEILKPVFDNQKETECRHKQNMRTTMEKKISPKASKVKEKSQFIEIQPESSDVEVPDNELLVYPPNSKKGGILITTVDYLGLGDGQLINDAIIEFYIKYLMLNIISPEDRDRTHVFGTYFFYTLSREVTQYYSDGMNEEEKLHSKVKNWTKNINIFEKDFIIIPIHDSLHWFVVILCFPGQTKTFSLKDGSTVPQKLVKKPCMLIFDSLSGNWTSKMSSNLRSYLSVEYKIKMGKVRKFTLQNFPEIHPQVMKQDNVTDCGLFLLQFVESFFHSPITDFNHPIKLKNWFNVEVIGAKRKVISDIIKMLMKKQNITHIKLPSIKITVNNKNTEDDESKQKPASSKTQEKVRPKDDRTKYKAEDNSEQEVESISNSNSESSTSKKKRKLEESKVKTYTNKIQKKIVPSVKYEHNKSKNGKFTSSLSQRLKQELKKEWECDSSPVCSQETKINSTEKETKFLKNPYVSLVKINEANILNNETVCVKNIQKDTKRNEIYIPIARAASEYNSDGNSEDCMTDSMNYIHPIAVAASDSSSESTSILNTSKYLTGKPAPASEFSTSAESVTSKSEKSSNKKKKVGIKKRNKC